MLTRVRALAQGTFLVRPSLSLAGAMVLSVVVDGVVKHMALDGNQLDTRSLEVGLPCAPVAVPAPFLECDCQLVRMGRSTGAIAWLTVLGPCRCGSVM